MAQHWAAERLVINFKPQLCIRCAATWKPASSLLAGLEVCMPARLARLGSGRSVAPSNYIALEQSHLVQHWTGYSCAGQW